MFYVIVPFPQFFFFFLSPIWAAVRVKTCSTFLGLCPLFFFFFFLSNSLLERSMILRKTSFIIIQHMDVGLWPVGCVHWSQGSQRLKALLCGCVSLEGLSLLGSQYSTRSLCADATERTTPNSIQVVPCYQLWNNIITSFPVFSYLFPFTN